MTVERMEEQMEASAVQVGLMSEAIARYRMAPGGKCDRVIGIGEEIITQWRRYREHQAKVRRGFEINMPFLIEMGMAQMERRMERMNELNEVFADAVKDCRGHG